MRVRAAFLFHLDQTLEMVAALSGSEAVFCLATEAKLEWLQSENPPYADVLRMLLAFPLAPAYTLQLSLDYLQGGASPR